MRHHNPSHHIAAGHGRRAAEVQKAGGCPPPIPRSVAALRSPAEQPAPGSLRTPRAANVLRGPPRAVYLSRNDIPPHWRSQGGGGQVE